MEETAKIRKLIDYWIKHNNEHIESYIRYAAKAEAEGNKELARILVKIYLESKRLTRLFESAKHLSN